MKKQLLKSALIAVAGVGLLAGSALATPTLPTGFSWTDAEYFSLTDFTTANVNTIIVSIDASYGADFGFYTVDNVSTPTLVTNTLKVYDKSVPEGYFSSYNTVTFSDLGGGSWEATANSVTTPFSSTFGFYFDIYTGGLNDNDVDYSWYSDSQFNYNHNTSASADTTIKHLLIAYSASAKTALIFLDDQLGALPADMDYNDKTVSVDDVAPVPEPATMFLFGTGLLGLAATARRKKIN